MSPPAMKPEALSHKLTTYYHEKPSASPTRSSALPGPLNRLDRGHRLSDPEAPPTFRPELHKALEPDMGTDLDMDIDMDNDRHRQKSTRPKPRRPRHRNSMDDKTKAREGDADTDVDGEDEPTVTSLQVKTSDPRDAASSSGAVASKVASTVRTTRARTRNLARSNTGQGVNNNDLLEDSAAQTRTSDHGHPPTAHRRAGKDLLAETETMKGEPDSDLEANVGLARWMEWCRNGAARNTDRATTTPHITPRLLLHYLDDIVIPLDTIAQSQPTIASSSPTTPPPAPVPASMSITALSAAGRVRSNIETYLRPVLQLWDRQQQHQSHSHEEAGESEQNQRQGTDRDPSPSSASRLWKRQWDQDQRYQLRLCQLEQSHRESVALLSQLQEQVQLLLHQRPQRQQERLRGNDAFTQSLNDPQAHSSSLAPNHHNRRFSHPLLAKDNANLESTFSINERDGAPAHISESTEQPRVSLAEKARDQDTEMTATEHHSLDWTVRQSSSHYALRADNKEAQSKEGANSSADHFHDLYGGNKSDRTDELIEIIARRLEEYHSKRHADHPGHDLSSSSPSYWSSDTYPREWPKPHQRTPIQPPSRDDRPSEPQRYLGPAHRHLPPHHFHYPHVQTVHRDGSSEIRDQNTVMLDESSNVGVESKPAPLPLGISASSTSTPLSAMPESFWANGDYERSQSQQSQPNNRKRSCSSINGAGALSEGERLKQARSGSPLEGVGQVTTIGSDPSSTATAITNGGETLIRPSSAYGRQNEKQLHQHAYQGTLLPSSASSLSSSSTNPLEAPAEPSAYSPAPAQGGLYQHQHRPNGTIAEREGEKRGETEMYSSTHQVTDTENVGSVQPTYYHHQHPYQRQGQSPQESQVHDRLHRPSLQEPSRPASRTGQAEDDAAAAILEASRAGHYHVDAYHNRETHHHYSGHVGQHVNEQYQYSHRSQRSRSSLYGDDEYYYQRHHRQYPQQEQEQQERQKSSRQHGEQHDGQHDEQHDEQLDEQLDEQHGEHRGEHRGEPRGEHHDERHSGYRYEHYHQYQYPHYQHDEHQNRHHAPNEARLNERHSPFESHAQEGEDYEGRDAQHRRHSHSQHQEQHHYAAYYRSQESASSNRSSKSLGQGQSQKVHEHAYHTQHHLPQPNGRAPRLTYSADEDDIKSPMAAMIATRTSSSSSSTGNGHHGLTGVGLMGVNASSIGPSGSLPPTPIYVMNRQVSTVHELWKEWTVGLGPGNPSIRQLEATYGPSWRSTSSAANFFSRRLRIINEIQRMVMEEGLTEDEAVLQMELKREQGIPGVVGGPDTEGGAAGGMSLHRLSEVLRKKQL